jgi:phospholipid-binding lipoprotein MlaA
MRQSILPPTVFASVLLLAGCATGPAADPRDPFEPLNHAVNSVNRDVDQAALKPVAKAYERSVPALVREGVSNFFSNLRDPWSGVNSLAQLKVGDAAQNAMRFAVNTFFGLGGVLDIATDAGIERHREDFGRTLAHWGVPAGPYMVLPILGPSTLRDTVALPADWLGDPLRFVAPVAERNALVAGLAVDTRTRMLPLDPVLDGALDRYTFMRDVYLQHRDAQVHGNLDGGGEAPSTDPAESSEASAHQAGFAVELR